MLVNLTVNKESEKYFLDYTKKYIEEYDCKNIILELANPNHEMWRPMTGVYEGPYSDPNFIYWLYDEFVNKNQPMFEDYGIADNLEQVIGYYKDQYIDVPEKYFLFFTKIYQNKDNAGNWGGWRWHKWGPYIGKLNPKHEYLDDEEFGEDFQGYVIVYSFYKVPE